jgi:N-acetylneuraminic acid mutarotase
MKILRFSPLVPLPLLSAVIVILILVGRTGASPSIAQLVSAESAGGLASASGSAAADAAPLEEGQWEQLPSAPIRLGDEGLVYDGAGHLLMPAGSGGAASADLYEFDIQTLSWSKRTPAPETMYTQKAVVAQGQVFILASCCSTLYRYDLGSDTWTVLMTSMPAYPMASSSLAYDGGRYIYTTGWSVGYLHLFRYDIVLNSWEELADPPPVVPGGQPEDVGANVATFSDGYLYLFGGSTLSGSSDHPIVDTNAVLRYEVATNSWTRLDDAPRSMSFNPGAKDDEGGVYIASGVDTSFYRYDLSTDTWTSLPDSPRVFRGASGAFDPVGSAFYVIWGRDLFRYRIGVEPGATPTPTPPGWSIMQPAPVPMQDNAAVFDGSGHLFVTAGRVDLNTPSNGFYRYDIASDTWTTLPPAPVFPAAGAACSIGGYLFVFGRWAAGQPFPQVFFVFDMTLGTWRQLATPPGLTVVDRIKYTWHNACATDGTSVYLFGGNTSTGPPGPIWTNAVFKYDIASDRWTRLPDAPTAMSNNVAAFDGRGKIFVTVGYDGSWYTNRMLSFEPSTASWSELPSAPRTMVADAGAYDLLQNILYVTAGQSGGVPYRDLFRFDAATAASVGGTIELGRAASAASPGASASPRVTYVLLGTLAVPSLVVIGAGAWCATRRRDNRSRPAPPTA